MTPPSQESLAHTTATAKRDQLCPLPCMRQDTGELIWLVQSRSDPSRYYLLTTTSDNVRCACPQAQHRGICAHAAAVRLALQAEHQPQNQSTAPQAPRQDPRSASQREQERRQRAESERRERAVLWTDDRPF